MKHESSSSSYRAWFLALAVATICARGTATGQIIRESSAATIQNNPTDTPRESHNAFAGSNSNSGANDNDKTNLRNGNKQIMPDDPERVLRPKRRNKKKNAKSAARIVGGDYSEVGEFPYFVEMGGCAGALIAPTVVLTAAHCSPEKKVGNFVTVGAIKRGSTEGGAKRIEVVEGISHPKYKNNLEYFLNNDYGLLRLKEPYIMDSDIQLVLNRDNNWPKNGEILDVIGMGYKKEDTKKLEDDLRDVQVPSFTNDECKGYYSSISNKMICAGGKGFDACQGDSGSPLVYREGNTHYHIGVTSWGAGCARKPGVYARSSKEFDWIEQQICETWGLYDSDICGTIALPGYRECRDNPYFLARNSRPGKKKDCNWVGKRWRVRCDEEKSREAIEFAENCAFTCRRCDYSV